MASIWGELKRRNVIKVALAYGIVGWLVLEISSVLGPALRLPEWSDSLVAFLLILGFPIALILSWAYEMTPEGIKLEKDVDRSSSVTHLTGRRLDFFIIAALSLALVFVVIDQYMLEETIEPDAASERSQKSVPAVAEERRGVLPNSVAVLPFENLSPNPDDAYFAAGLHEEILSQLAKLRDLSVISRTSVLRYAGTGLSIPEIAKELNVETVMEGSVRYANNRVRITTQLIDAATDEHLWSETYDREFADIFAIETDIATNIANALEAEFSLAEKENISSVPTSSPEAFSLYLRALNDMGPGGYGAMASTPAITNSTAYLDQAIEIDSEFADAYALRAQAAWALMGRAQGTADQRAARRQDLEESASGDLRRAIELDPNHGPAYMTTAYFHQSHWRGTEAREAFEFAHELAPNDAYINSILGLFYASTGNYTEAIRLARRGVDLQPNSVTSHHLLGVAYAFAGDDQAAFEALQRATADPINPSHVELAWLEFRRGNMERALEYARIAERIYIGAGSPDRFVSLITYAYGLAGSTADATRIFEMLQERSKHIYITNESWMFAYLGVRDADQALHHLKLAAGKWAGIGRGQISIKTNYYHDPILEQPEFVEVRSMLGFKD